MFCDGLFFFDSRTVDHASIYQLLKDKIEWVSVSLIYLFCSNVSPVSSGSSFNFNKLENIDKNYL